MGIEDRYYDENTSEDFKSITEISDFKILFSDEVELNFCFFNKKTNKKENYLFKDHKKYPTTLERIFFKKENDDWKKQKVSWEFNKYIIPSVLKALIEKEKSFEESIKSRKIEAKKRYMYAVGNWATRASVAANRGIYICECKLKHIKNLIEYLDPNLQIRANLSIEEEENGK